MVKRDQIHEHMRVVCQDGVAFVVDGLEGDRIRLTRDDRGGLHWIPLDWATDVRGDSVVLDRDSQQVRAEWIPEAPPTSSGGPAR